MSLTKDDLQAIGALMDGKLDTALAPINKRLDTMQGDIRGLQADITEVKDRVTKIEQRVTNIEQRVVNVEQRVVKIELTQENEVLRNIQILAEGHIGVVEKLRGLERLPSRVEEIQDTVEVLKYVFKEHVEK